MIEKQEQTLRPTLIQELEDQSINPPGKDQVLGAFYTASVALVQDPSHPLSRIIRTVCENRSGITDKHLTSLLYRGYQHVKFRDEDLSYRNFNNPSQWEDELTTFLEDPQSAALFTDTLQTRSTTTTIYQRYAGPYAVLSNLYGDRPISIADLGCGGNYGLRGFDQKIPFNTIYDHTPRATVSSLLTNRINLRDGIAIDQQDPDEAETQRWRLACRFYPGELDNLNETIAFENQLQQSERVRFVQGDLLKPTSLPRIRPQDAVILSTVLYQLDTDQRTEVLETAKKLLAPKGVIIVQDFAGRDRLQPNGLDFDRSWFGSDDGYRTFIACANTSWSFLEALRWNNGRCTSVKRGAHFDEVFSRLLAPVRA